MITTLDDFIREFKEIQKKGWIQTHRSGPTGIGKTLEDLLGIPENNSGEPDFGVYELKAARLNSSSMLTLFTLAPQPPKANGVLLQKYGYIRDGKRVLRTTLSTDRFAKLPSNHTLKVSFVGDTMYFESNLQREDIFYKETALLEAMRRKYAGELVYAYAERKGSKKDEYFKFHSAYTAKMNYDTFLHLLKEGIIKVDLRLGLYPDGRTHDHGTGFRIRPADQEKLLHNKQQIV